jgi:hypothetical protein
MFKFKALEGFHNAVDFSFSSILGDAPNIGICFIIVGGSLGIRFYGIDKILHEINHPLEGYPEILFDEFCHITIILDHTNNFMT